MRNEQKQFRPYQTVIMEFKPVPLFGGALAVDLPTTYADVR